MKISDLPRVLPVFPLTGAIILPRGQLPLNIFEPRYLNMIDDAMAGDRMIGMIQPSGGPRTLPSLSGVGCAGRITSFVETSDGRYLITLTGICRFRPATELPASGPYRQVQADYLSFSEDLAGPDGEEALDRQAFLAALRAYLEARSLEVDWETARNAPPEALINSLAMALPLDPAEKQALLEAGDLAARARTLEALLRIDAVDPGEDAPRMQ